MPDIRLLQSSWNLIDTLKRVWNFSVNYAPIRLAIGRSLLSGDVPDFELRGEDGRAIDTQQIFSGGGTDYTALYRALIVQRHRKPLTDDEFLQILRLHVDHGFALIANDTKEFRAEDDYVDYLVELTRNGLDQRDLQPAPAIEATPAYSGLLNLHVGWNNETGDLVKVEFNRQTNNYLAVTGKPGSGKTQFVKDLLAQIRLQSEYKVNFVFFDYAKGDVADDSEFVATTQADVIRLPEESLPLNPFARVNVGSETAVKVAAQEFADLIRDLERRMGVKQGERLYSAVLSGFETMRGADPPFPDFEISNKRLIPSISFRTIFLRIH